MNNKRILFNKDCQFAITKNETTGVTTLTGYAMVWNAVSSDRGGYFVRLLPASANAAPVTYALVNHDWNQLLAVNTDNSLRLSNDSVGVKVEIDMPNTTYGNDYAWLVANNKVKGMSFAMDPRGAEFKETEENGSTILNFSKFTFDEVTITPIPAFEETSIAVATPAASNANTLTLADNKETEKFADDANIEKVLADESVKIETYRLSMYPSVAEFQAADTESDNLETTHDQRTK